MKIIRNFQVFVVLMLAFLCAGIGMNDVYAEDNNGYEKIRFNVGKVNEKGVDLSEVKGLDWDVKNGILTMDGYKGGELHIYTVDETSAKIDVVVKGENTISDFGFSGIMPIYVSITFKGDGTLNIYSENAPMGMGIGHFQYDDINITIDGPTINILGNYLFSLYVNDFKMYSGTLNMDRNLISGEYNSAIMVNGKAEILGGTIVVKYKKNYGINNVDPIIYLNNHKEAEGQPVAVIENCAIIAVADLSVSDKLELIKYDSDKYTIKIGDNFNFIKTDSLDMVTAIDISKFKPSLLETKYTYDGKAKTPKVKVGGLVEGNDFTVKYIDNVKPGKATAIVTGKGLYSGEVKLYFTIEENKDSLNKEGSTIKDADYIYKVLKAGTLDGKVIGKVALVGLNNKKLKNIKVANTVTIDKVTYKVTEIGAKAFKNNKKIKSVIIGKNVKKIGKQAFYKCKKLKKITIKTNKLKKKSIGASAFKGIYKKAKIKVPKKKLKLYKKFIKKAKAPKKCKISR